MGPSGKRSARANAALTALSYAAEVVMEMELSGKRAAVLVEQQYQELEVWYPIYRLREAGCQVTVHQHLDGTLSITHGPHLLARYTAEGARQSSTKMSARRAVEKTQSGKVQKPTFPLCLEIPHTPRDSHFPTAPTAAGLT